jgi:glutathione S-transferase
MTNDRRQAWTDERLDDLVRRVNGMPERVIRLEQQFANFDADLAELKTASHALVVRLEHRENEQAQERKQDRRWLVGSCFTAAGLVIAALGLLADKL